MEAEFIAYFETLNHRIRLWNFIMGLHVVDGIERPLKIYYDNKDVVLYFENNISSLKSKHIDIKYFVVKKRVQNQHVLIKHINRSSMIADPLIKVLLSKVFHEHVAHLSVLFNDVCE